LEKPNVSASRAWQTGSQINKTNLVGLEVELLEGAVALKRLGNGLGSSSVNTAGLQVELDEVGVGGKSVGDAVGHALGEDTRELELGGRSVIGDDLVNTGREVFLGL
jgi:hypothetical protein